MTSPVTTIFDPKPRRVRNIFICSGEVFCASSRMMKASLSVRPRMNASGATSMVPAASSLGIVSGSSMSCSASYSGPQVGVDLLAQRAGQVAEPLPRLDRRPGEDDPVDVLGLQRLHGLGHREVGLAGAGGADAEDDRVLVDGVDVPLLVQRLRPDRAAAVGQDVEAQHVGGPLLGLRAQHADRPLDGLGGQPLAGAHDRDQLVDQPLGERQLGGLAAQRDVVAPDVDVGVERLLDQREVLVVAARAATPC